MAETTAPPPDLDRAAEEAVFYHEAALNASWTGIRLALGALSLGFGAFIFAFFYLKSLNSHGLWYPSGFHGPQPWVGATVMGLIVVSAVVQTVVLSGPYEYGTKDAPPVADLNPPAGVLSAAIGGTPLTRAEA